jgi:eukaryotic-like serine/threonine-protein kinase
MTPHYVRGLAYLGERKPADAAAEFQFIMQHRSFDLYSPLVALSHLQLARAWAQQGETPKTRQAYQDFFAFWKDADPDIPILKEAKAEYEKLK